MVVRSFQLLWCISGIGSGTYTASTAIYEVYRTRIELCNRRAVLYVPESTVFLCNRLAWLDGANIIAA